MDAWPPAAGGDVRRTYDPAQHAGGDSTLIRMFEADTPPPRARPPPIATPPSPAPLPAQSRHAPPQVPTLESPTGLEASARAVAGAGRRVAAAKRAGTYFEIAFDEAQLGFAARLARVHGPERKRPRAWCAVTVESVDDEFPVAAEHLCRGDEVVAVDGEPIAIRDDPQYDSRCRKAAFAALKSRIAKAPRPVTLGFVRGARDRDEARRELHERLDMAAADRDVASAHRDDEGLALRAAADAAAADAQDAASRNDAPGAARAAKALRGAARAARRRVVMARLRYAATCDPSRDLDEAEATDAHCVAKRAQADLEALAAARRVSHTARAPTARRHSAPGSRPASCFYAVDGAHDASHDTGGSLQRSSSIVAPPTASRPGPVVLGAPRARSDDSLPTAISPASPTTNTAASSPSSAEAARRAAASKAPLRPSRAVDAAVARWAAADPTRKPSDSVDTEASVDFIGFERGPETAASDRAFAKKRLDSLLGRRRKDRAAAGRLAQRLEPPPEYAPLTTPLGPADATRVQRWARTHRLEDPNGDDAGPDWTGVLDLFAGRGVTLEDVVACYDGAADEETALLQARRRKTEQLKADRLARERREAQSKRDEAVRARQNQRFARKQAAREHDSRLVAALAERSKAALKRCQAAEKKVRACARAAKLAAGDARHIEGLVRDARRRAPPPAVTSRCK